MKFQLKNQILNIVAASLMTAAMLLVVPADYFTKYTLKVISKKSVPNNTGIYYEDIDHDGIIEMIRYDRNDKIGRVFQIEKPGNFLDNYNLEVGEYAISLNLSSSDINNNGIKEFYFVSANDHVAFLNVLEFNEHSCPQLIKRKIVLDSVSVYNHLPDVANNFIEFTPDQKVVLGLQAGYSIQPRRLYLYDFNKDALIKGPETSIATRELKVINLETTYYFLPLDAFASGNTVSINALETYAKSKDKDTLALFRKYHDKAYRYGDFASYTLLYNSKLDFEFPPVEYFGWTTWANSDAVLIDKQLYIFTLVRKSKDSSSDQVLNMIDLKGKVVNSKTLSDGKWSLLDNTETDKIYLMQGPRIRVLDTHLDLIKEVELVKNQSVLGFKDIDDDGRQEFITIHNNSMNVFPPDLKSKTSAELNICNADMQSYSIFETFKKGDETFINLEIGETSFVLQYQYNKKYYLKYLFYILLFGGWYFILWGILKLNSKRLQAENRKLEITVNQRTTELSRKNNILLSQKEEINAQAEQLISTNEHLVELSNFKELMTNTVVHDLKNPLNSIINLSQQERVTQSAESMLNLVMNILDIQKYEDQKMVLNIEDVFLHEVVQAAVDKVKLLLDERNIIVFEKYSRDVELRIDKETIIRVFVNLLSNAIKFSPVNGRILLDASMPDQNKVLIQLIDQGPGISESKLESIFNKFEQAESRDSGSVRSTGLGLAFCKMAIEAHQGEIRAENNKSGGAVFIVTLPGKVAGIQLLPVFNVIAGEDEKFTLAELQILTPVLQKLKTIKVFEATEVLGALSEVVTENKRILSWINRVKKAVFSGNTILYNSLINFE